MKAYEHLDTLSKLLMKVVGSPLPKYIRSSCARKFRRRNLGKRILSHTDLGCQMITQIGDNVDIEIALTGKFEPHITSVILKIIDGLETGNFVDTGCHIGYYSNMVAARSPGIKITAVDANQAMINRCRENLELNGKTGNLINVGVGDSHSVLAFNTSKKSPSLGTFGTKPDEVEDLETIQVKVVPFSEIIETTDGTIVLLKIDVEGFEYPALSSLRADQISRIENMIIEFSDLRLKQCGRSRDEFENLPWLSDYDLKLICEKGNPIPLASLKDVPLGDQNIWLIRKG